MPSPAVTRLVLVCHLHDLLPRVLPYEIGVIGCNVRLDILDERVVGLALDVGAAGTMDNLHERLLGR